VHKLQKKIKINEEDIAKFEIQSPRESGGKYQWVPVWGAVEKEK